MGRRLALAARNALTGVPHAPARMFAFMAVVADDRDAVPRYWAGREDLAISLGVEPDVAGFKAVDRAVNTLRKLGLIKSEGAAYRGKRSAYVLCDGEGQPLKPLHPGERGAVLGEHPGERGVSNSESTPVNGRKHPGERENAPRSPGPQTGGTGITGGAAGGPPPRACQKHPNWLGSDPCRACMADRKSAEDYDRAQGRENSRALAAIPSDASCEAFNRAHRWLAGGTCMNCTARLEQGMALTA